MSKDILPISVIIPCFRSAQTIRRAVDSVRFQTQLPTQILLIDDASNDGSLDILFELQGAYPELNIVVDSLDQNLGPGAARNRGWDLATQPWLAFLDADDAWCPEKLELQWSWISAHIEAVLVGHENSEVLADNTSKWHKQDSGNVSSNELIASRISFKKMLIANRFYTRTVMMLRSLPFRFSDRRYTEDYLLWLEIILAGYPGYVIHKEMAVTFRPEFSVGGFSAQLWTHEKRELRAWLYLFRQHQISLIILLLAVPWSYLKYSRRVCKRFFHDYI